MRERKGWQEIYTAANLVTIMRILLVPAFIILMLAPWASWLPEPALAAFLKPWVAAAVFILLAASDGLDGYLARSRGEVSVFGKLLDPIADKILVAAALLALIELRIIPAWIALVILGREFLVSGLRMVAAAEGKVIDASMFGKTKTVFQIIAVVTFIIKESLETIVSWWFGSGLSWVVNIFAWTVMALTLIITIGSLIDYFINSAEVLGFERSGPWQRKENGDKGAGVSELSTAELSAQVLELARARGLTVGTAESCTGGLVAASLTEVAGASDVFMGAVVSYDNGVKQGLLSVADEVFVGDGAVSEACVLQMAEGACGRLGVDVAVAVSGIAGPDGGSEAKPVGTVWLAVSALGQATARCRHFDGGRQEVREQAVHEALAMLAEALGGL